jgi:hypothetical protein
MQDRKCKCHLNYKISGDAFTKLFEYALVKVPKTCMNFATTIFFFDFAFIYCQIIFLMNVF